MNLLRMGLVMAGATVVFGASAAWAGLDDPKAIALIELNHTPAERPSPLAWLVGSGDAPTLREVLGLLDDVMEDDAMSGVVVRLRGAELGATQVEEIGRAMDRVRAKGKKVHLFADAYSTAELVLGAHADEVIMQAGGVVLLPGLHMEEMYLADSLGWAGIKADMVQVGDYKGASERMARSGPSPEWDQNINALLDGLYGNLREAIKEGRRLDDAALDRAMSAAWMADAATAKEQGLIDGSIDLPELSPHLEKGYGAGLEWTTLLGEESHFDLAGDDPLEMMMNLMQVPDAYPTRESIAVLHIDGPIVDGESSEGGMFGGASVGSWTIRQALEEIENEELIKGVVVRINSPGGSAVASEVMWQGIRRVSEKKPVWVSVGSMAASGGYYVAVAGGPESRIYVNESSIVGSIGVVGGKVTMGGLLEKLKVGVVERSRGPVAGMMSSTRPWSEQERQMVRSKMTETYDLFVSRVTAGRPGIDVSRTAEGRLFTGAAAIELKLADRIGGLDEAITELAAELSLEQDGYDVMEYPGPQGLGEIIGEMLGGLATLPGARRNGVATQAAAAAGVGVLREAVGPAAWPAVRDSLEGLVQMRREPVLLMSPSVIVVR